MNIGRAGAALAFVAMLGCEQTSQELPLEPETGETVSRLVGPEGGAVSTPAGLSLDFRPGSLERATEITLTQRSGREVGADVSGQVVEGTVFDVSPSGTQLGAAARLSLQVPPETLDEVDPMALTAVLVSGAEVRYLSVASVDLRAGILKTDVPRLGTVGLRVSDDVVAVDPGSRANALLAAPLAAAMDGAPAATAAGDRTAEFGMGCGAEGQPTCAETDAISLTLSQDLYDAFNGCVQFIDPEVRVELTLEQTDTQGATGRARGTVVFSGTVRYETGSDGTACGSGSGSVQSLSVADTLVLGNDESEWTPFSFNADAQTLTFWLSSTGAETLHCDCGPGLFDASEIWVGQSSEPVTFEGLSGQVTWAVRLRR